jgi:hypothetical protein
MVFPVFKGGGIVGIRVTIVTKMRAGMKSINLSVNFGVAPFKK